MRIWGIEGLTGELHWHRGRSSPVPPPLRATVGRVTSYPKSNRTKAYFGVPKALARENVIRLRPHVTTSSKDR